MTKIWILAERKYYGFSAVRAYSSEERARLDAEKYGTDEERNPRAIVYAIELETSDKD